MKICISIILLLLSGHIMAQQADSTTFKTGSYVSFTVNDARSLTDLNRQLQAAGHAPIVEALIGITLGVTNRFADQNSYSASRLSLLVASDDALDDSRKTTLLVWELAGFGHYDLITNPKWLAYPYLGTGVNYGRLMVSAIEPTGNFQNSLNNLGNNEVVQKRYGSDGLMLFGELGAGVERVLTLQNSDLYIGLSGGYRLSTDRSWALSGVKTFDASFSTQGWMFEVKTRAEVRPERTSKVSRGLFKFFN